jgi:uncharacterized Zn-binding protein involved in type VI secretion
MSNASRISDSHTCPVSGPIPHVGGVVQGPGVPSVLIGNLAAATAGTLCACAFVLPNAIASGSTTVVIGNKAAARVGDPTAHGGVITSGCPTVVIGG